MRDNFSKPTKETLAKRVSYRCSFPNCPITTIGPGHKSSSDITNLGEAAHIHAASTGGPRYDPNMTEIERKSIENGIWMCRHHATLIDSDYINYSADTLRQWKMLAEEKASKALIEIDRTLEIPSTLISIGSRLIFEGIWKSVSDNGVEWKFNVCGFVMGSLERLKELSIKGNSGFDYLIVETEGVGRTLKKNIQWQLVGTTYEVTISANEQSPRVNPDGFVDYGLDEDGDLDISDGDFRMAKGVECAANYLSDGLSYCFGDLKYAPLVGSYFSEYYWQYRDNLPLLNRLLKIELTRLIFIPTDESGTATLNFINRISKAAVLSTEIVNNRIPVYVSLEWGNGKIWEGTINVYIHSKK